MTTRVMPPADGLHPTIVIAGRSYTCALGATIDVPDADALVMAANGWTAVGDGVGATAGRPATPVRGQEFHDTTLGYNIRFDGKAWRNPSTGVAV